MIEKTPQPSAIQSYIDRNQEAQSPLEQEEQPIEIIIGPEDGEEVISLETEDTEAPAFDANLAEFISDDVLSSLATELLDDFDNDKQPSNAGEST